MDNDKGSIMDVGCYERGCACVASDSAAGVDSECVPVVRYKPWVGLTDEEIAEGAKQSWVDKQAFESAVWWADEKLKEKNT